MVRLAFRGELLASLDAGDHQRYGEVDAHGVGKEQDCDEMRGAYAQVASFHVEGVGTWALLRRNDPVSPPLLASVNAALPHDDSLAQTIVRLKADSEDSEGVRGTCGAEVHVDGAYRLDDAVGTRGVTLGAHGAIQEGVPSLEVHHRGDVREAGLQGTSPNGADDLVPLSFKVGKSEGSLVPAGNEGVVRGD
jgi:hypothetical protein